MKRLSVVILAPLWRRVTHAQTASGRSAHVSRTHQVPRSRQPRGAGKRLSGSRSRRRLHRARHFGDAGLEPAGDNGTFFQRFEMITGLSVQPGNVFTLQAGRSSVDFEIGRDYQIGVDLERSVVARPTRCRSCSRATGSRRRPFTTTTTPASTPPARRC